jgi:hypothetical protein
MNIENKEPYPLKFFNDNKEKVNYYLGELVDGSKDKKYAGFCAYELLDAISEMMK